MMKNYLLLLISIFTIACESENVSPKDEEKEQPQPIEAEVEFRDLVFSGRYVATDNTLFPSLVLAQAAYQANTDEKIAHLLLELTAPRTEATDLSIKLLTSEFTNESVVEGVVENKDSYQVWPELSWNYSALQSAVRPSVFTLPISVSIDNKTIGRKNIEIPYRSVHECPVFFIDQDNVITEDLAWMFAAYVDEHHPYIDVFLGDVLRNTSIVNSFSGYQKGEQGVIDQVQAIWFHMQKLGVKYSSITTTSNTQNAVVSQFIRPISDVIDNTQANCVDGSVFLASVLRKINISPFLVLVPEHMFLGYYTNVEKTKIQLLETTEVGSVSLIDITADSFTDYASYVSLDDFIGYQNGSLSLDDYKAAVSKGTFQTATSVKNAYWNSNIEKFNNNEEFMFQILDIDALRVFVQPLGLD